MGNLSNYESNEIGKARMDTLRRFGGDAERLCDGLYQLAAGYNGFRAGLNPAEDAEDISYCDSSFDYSVAQCLPKLEMLTVEERVWLVRFLDGLGFIPKPQV
jgi:hypothetical protein